MIRRRPCKATALGWGGVILSALALTGDGSAQSPATAHTIFMTAVEIKGATTAEKLPPPAVAPANLSKGYGTHHHALWPLA